ncbi:MAG: hypothetical protein V4594_00525 [Bacteroidota bacterium]
MKKHNLLLLSLIILGLLAFIPKAEEPIERLVSSLQKWVDKNPQEKVYLHMDKPYYALGDTVWFKAYVTIGSRHQLSKLSGALYVELIDEKDSLLSALKLPLTAGMALGDFTLGDEYKAGNFRIRAYTQWMRNAGEDYFFDKTFVVGDPLSLEADFGLKSQDKNANRKGAANRKGQSGTLNSSDLQFFPEGGNLVNGINSRMGFKAVATNGRGIAVKGVVTDGTGVEVSGFETLHAGMGVFNFRPEAGKTYKAKVTFSDGSEKLIDLPKALEQGYVLSVYQPGPDSVLVRINASPAQYQIPYAVDLMVHAGGETVSATTVKINKAVNSVWLMKKDFPGGIAQFTLFDGRGEPINERIAFIRARDQMQLELNTAKKSYKSRERVDLELEAMDKTGKPVAGNFSVSVIDESKTPSDENTETTIFSSMLLSSDIKGYIEEPNYYFRKDTAEVNKALDNLMLTQGYRRFDWEAVLSPAAPSVQKFRPESLGTEISGRVATLGGKPVANGQVTLMSIAQGFMELTKTDADGRFKYSPMMLADSIRFAIQATTDKKSKKVELILDEVPEQEIGKNKYVVDAKSGAQDIAKAYLENSKKQDDLLARTGGISRVNRLREVNIRVKKAAELTYATQGGLRIPDGHADSEYIMKDGDKCPSLGICLQGKLGPINFRKNVIDGVFIQNYPYSRNLPIAVILDGQKVTSGIELAQILDQNVLDPAEVVKVDVVRANLALRAILGEFAILIYTKRGRVQPPKYNPNMANIKPKGFNKARTFYAPRYDRPGVTQQLPDLRSTIYWNAGLKTDSSGKGSFGFFNADGPGIYKVVVEGINSAGELARQVYRYEVEEGMSSNLPEPVIGNSNELVKAIQGFHDRMPAEKLYIHTDKPYYNLGDTLWFKAYLFDAASLTASKKSGLLYVELNDDTAEAVRRISIPIKEGIGYAQMPLTSKIFHQGSYTLRAYTNWMQNFGEDCFFTQRFYLGVPTKDTWLVKSSSKISKVGDKDQLEIGLLLNKIDQSPVALREVELKIMEGDNQLYKEQLQTGRDGLLHVNYALKERADGKNIRVEISSLHPNDGNQRLQVPLDIFRNQKIDLQFLPEGGKLVAGFQSVVGFKAIGENGKGVDVTGEVFDSKGISVGSFSSLFKGMGAFRFLPKAGESYHAILKQAEQSDKKYALPAVQRSGTVLSILNPESEDSIQVKVLASEGALHPDSLYYLVATSRGVLSYVQNIDPARTAYRVAKSSFPGGIIRFSLLRNRVPLNERSMFIDHGEQMKVVLQTNKTSYYKGDRVEVALQITDKKGKPLSGNFSLSVTDNSQVRADTAGNYGITAGLLISADLKGTVESPAYYLNRKNKQSWQALDYLMLTQGWVDYNWKDVFNSPNLPRFEAETQLTVKGIVTNILNKPVKGAQMVLSSQKPSFVSTSISDELGRYSFQNLPDIDSGSFFIQAKTPKGKTMNFGAVTVNSFEPPVIKNNAKNQLMPWYVDTDTVQLNYVRNIAKSKNENRLRNAGIALKEVTIRSKKIIRNSYSDRLYKPDLVFDALDIKESAATNLYQLLRQKLPGIRIDNSEGFPTLTYNKRIVDIFIDGYAVPIYMTGNSHETDLKDQMISRKIVAYEGLEVYYNRGFANKAENARFSFGLNGVRQGINSTRGAAISAAQSKFQSNPSEFYIHHRFQLAMSSSNKAWDFATIYITTNADWNHSINNKPDNVTLRPLPVMRPQEFYSPKYVLKPADAEEPDFRSTLYWKPDLLTDVQGRARVVFYTSDVAGAYTLNLQGSDMDGNIGSFTSVIKVQ